MRKIVVLSLIILFGFTSFNCGNSETSPAITPQTYRVVYSTYSTVYTGLRIATIDASNSTVINETVLTEGTQDLKPSWSMDGTKIVFFRIISGSTADLMTCKTKLCVINSDGTGLVELTNGSNGDFNATFMRDGSNRIIFLRLNQTTGNWATYIINLNGPQGSELAITDLSRSEAGFTTTRSGKVLGNYHASAGIGSLVFNPGSVGTYTTLNIDGARPYWDHYSLSMDETKLVTEVCYSTTSNRNNFSVSIADINMNTYSITNVRTMVTPNSAYWDGYPRWSPDGKYVLFHSNKTGKYLLYLYEVSTGNVSVLPLSTNNYLFPCFEYAPV